MSERRIERWSRTNKRKGRTDWERLDALTDAEIERDIAEDPDAAPILDEDFWREATVVMPTGKVPLSIRLDADVVEFFKAGGRGYQTRINAVLRSYMDHEKGRNG